MKHVPPVFPEFARHARLQGMVIVLIVVDALGKVRCAKAVSGHALLKPGAVKAALQWEFRPLVRAGKTYAFRGCLLFRAELLGQGWTDEERENACLRDLRFRFADRAAQ
ncbi:MAG: TonB family protein [Acidobacteria bacterium]|nr:TonB family protein [Acidobacteriota bacterium]